MSSASAASARIYSAPIRPSASLRSTSAMATSASFIASSGATPAAARPSIVATSDKPHSATTWRIDMPFDQYHEPTNELPDETRTFARMILSLIEEAEAIDWYEQRLAVPEHWEG